jgi:hypothetical protein
VAIHAVLGNATTDRGLEIARHRRVRVVRMHLAAVPKQWDAFWLMARGTNRFWPPVTARRVNPKI